MTYFEDLSGLFSDLAENSPGELQRVPDALFRAWDAGGTVYSFGNGGSASDSLHFTTELVAKVKEEPIQCPAISLNASQSTLTATANDWSFEVVFEKQVETHVTADDVVIGISTSGNSENVLRGLRRASELGATCFGLTDSDGGRMNELDVDVIRVPSSTTAHVQEAHIACLHWICYQVDARLNG